MKKISLIAAMISILLFSCDNMVGDLMEEFTRNVICVNQNASGKETGRGWKDAYIRLQDAIDNAKDGDEIWIAGDYDSLSTQITINKNIKIVGGFDENDQLKGDRPGNSRSKVYGAMSTAPGGAFIEIDTANIIFENLDLNNADDNGRTVYIDSDAEVTMENCTFRNDKYNGTGGSIRVFQSYLNLLNTTFSGTTGEINAQDGGAINAASSVLNLNGCTFSKISSSSNGGAIYANQSEVNISDCVFNGNTATTNGGAIYTVSSDEINISDCTFNANKSNGSAANDGGGAIYSSYSNLTISENCLFDRNTTAHYGGAICIDNSSLIVSSKCEFSENESIGNGGAIYARNLIPKSLVISQNCTFTANFSADNGGAIYGDSVKLDISQNCIFESNEASNNGGAIYISACKYNISDSKLISNVSNSGGGIYCEGGYPGDVNYISNCVFNNNQSYSHGGVIRSYVAGSIELNILNSSFYNNYSISASGGALCKDGDSTINVYDSRFFSNSASGVKNSFDSVYGYLSTLYLYNTYVD